MHILQINSSPRREASHSTRLADAIVARLQARYPVATVLQRNLAHSTMRNWMQKFWRPCSRQPTNWPTPLRPD